MSSRVYRAFNCEDFSFNPTLGILSSVLAIVNGLLMIQLIKCMALLALFAGFAQSTVAEVNLSADGRTLSGVEIDGKIYDVHFRDGIINQVYPLATITAPGWSDFAASAWAAVEQVLSQRFPTLSPAALNGCGTSTCEILIPLRPAESSIPNQDAAYSVGRIYKPGSDWRRGTWPQYDANTNTAATAQVTLMTLTPSASGPVFTLSLEEPIRDEVHGGIGNLRGWAVAEDGIDRIEMWLNGSFLFEMPYGGDRSDVAAAYPNVAGAQQSGYSMAFGYSNLGAGTHTMTVRAYNNAGDVLETSATFTVVELHNSFIPASDEVSVEDASCSLDNDEISLRDVSIDGVMYDLLLKWRTAEQGFEIIEAR